MQCKHMVDPETADDSLAAFTSSVHRCEVRVQDLYVH